MLLCCVAEEADDLAEGDASDGDVSDSMEDVLDASEESDAYGSASDEEEPMGGNTVLDSDSDLGSSDEVTMGDLESSEDREEEVSDEDEHSSEDLEDSEAGSDEKGGQSASFSSQGCMSWLE